MLKQVIAVVLVVLVATAASAGGYRYVSAEKFKEWQENGKKTVIVDIQVPVGFEKRHFKGAIETNAFPAKSEEERKRLDTVLERIRSTQDDVVIVCPRGGGGAKNTYDYLKEKGVEEKRLFILEKGMDGWPYGEMCVSGR
ncbi:MAG TPA: rhodanese-like domain-containing protein [Desulfuromonadaceae bacterium]